MPFHDFGAALRQRRWLPGVLLLVAGAALYLGLQRWRGPAVEALTVRRGDIVQTIVASGHVATPLRVEIGSQVTATVAAIPVAEGQRVGAGQLLIGLENREAQAAVTQARAAVAQAAGRLRQLQEVALPAAQQGLLQARVNLQNAERQYARSKELRSQGFVGQSQLDDMQHNRDLAASQLRSAQLQVDSNGVAGSEYRIAADALEQARAGLRMAQARLGYTALTAPLAGTLIARNVERGDVVQPGKALMLLSPDGPTQLVLQVDEKNLALLHTGQAALASADAYPGQRFAATLSYISPAVDAQRGSVEVKLDVAQAPAYLRQDMPVSVDIEVARRKQTLLLPAAALHDSGGAAPWVLALRDGHARRQAVRLGLRGGGQAEVLDGVQAGDTVIGTGAAVADGQRVRLRTPARKAGS